MDPSRTVEQPRKRQAHSAHRAVNKRIKTPSSAYNFFVRRQLELVLTKQKKKPRRKDLAKAISQRWNALSHEEHQHCRDLADADSARYRKERITQLLQTQTFDIAEAATKEDGPRVAQQQQDDAAWARDNDSRSFLFAEANGANLSKFSLPAAEFTQQVNVAVVTPLYTDAAPGPQVEAPDWTPNHRSVIPPHSILHRLSRYRRPPPLGTTPSWNERLSLVPPPGSMMVDRWDSLALKYALWLRRKKPTPPTNAHDEGSR